MTELLIAGVQVVLPADMNLTVKRENPFFTKNGEYTYDLTLKLDNPVNAELYKHLNRVNSVSEITEKRPAVLIADNRVYCNGTEIITGWTEKTVTIQIASGNSELNYFIGSDLMISFLEIWDESPFNPVLPDQKWVRKLYPEIDFCLSPIFNNTSGILINEWRLNTTPDFSYYELINKPNFTPDDYIPQPFLCAYIKKLLLAIGYELVENSIENTIWKDLYITHVYPTTQWSKMLPGWKVSDFLEQVELLFNVSFVIDSRKRTAKLLFNNSYYLNSPLVHVTAVIDEYEAEKTTDNLSFHQHANIRYAFPDTSYYRHRDLPESIKQTARRRTIPESFAEEHGELYLLEWFSLAENKVPNMLFTDEKTGREFIFMNEKSMGGYVIHYQMVNEFAAIERDGAEDTLDIEMMPVSMRFHFWHLYTNGVQQWNHLVGKLPVIENVEITDSDDGEELERSFEDMLEEGLSENSETKSPIFLAFHGGLNNMDASILGIPGNSFPTPFTDDLIINTLRYEQTNTNGATLRLIKFDEELYTGAYEIDENSPMTFVSYDPNVHDPRSVFEIRNKRYICRDIEYVLTPEGRKKAWKGVFHPIKISDSEVYQRWILADGKWRDGGVWLDNGRWLDE